MTRREHVAEMMLRAMIVARPGMTVNEMIGLVPSAVRVADELLAMLAQDSPPASNHESPKEGPPSGCTAGVAGEHERGCVVPRGDGLAMTRGTAGFDLAPDSTSQPATAGTNPASPVQVFDCEGRFPVDAPCPGSVSLDPVTKGRFCATHLAVEESFRREFHRLHGDRNRPAAKARRIAEALG